MISAIKVLSGGFVAVFVSIVFASDAARATVVASDNASNGAYSDGWQAGDNGGAGLAPWTFTVTGSGNSSIDRTPLPANSLGAPAFALTTGTGFDTIEAFRPLLVPLAVGQTLSVNINGSKLGKTPLYSMGNTFDLLTGSDNYRFSLYTTNGFNDDHWNITGDLDTGVAGEGSFHLDFTLASANTYNLVLSPVAGGAPFYTRTGATLAGATGASIAKMRISNYGTGSSADGSTAYFFDDLMINSPGVAGDLNQDGSANAADYVFWRKANGSTSDYATWRANFGLSSTTDSPSLSVRSDVPEPSGSALFAAGFAVVTSFSFPSRSRRPGALGRLG